MVLVPLHTQKLMIVTRKLSYSVESDFPLLSLKISTQHTPNGPMTQNCKSLMVRRATNMGGGLCVYHQFLKIKPLLSGFPLQSVQQPGCLRNFGWEPWPETILQLFPHAVCCSPHRWDVYLQPEAHLWVGEGSWDSLLSCLCPFLAVFSSSVMPSSERDVPFKDEEATALWVVQECQGRKGSCAPMSPCTHPAASCTSVLPPNQKLVLPGRSWSGGQEAKCLVQRAETSQGKAERQRNYLTRNSLLPGSKSQVMCQTASVWVPVCYLLFFYLSFLQLSSAWKKTVISEWCM